MERVGDDHWRIGRWLAIAVDGSRVSTPRTKANEKAFRAANYGKGKTAKYRKKKSKNKRKKNRTKAATVTPQIWITLLWHMGLRLPWSWKLGPSNSSERAHFQDMLATQTFPETRSSVGTPVSLVTIYGARSLIRENNFLIRVGGNVRLLTRLGYYARERNGIVYVWPDSAARKKQPPLGLAIDSSERRTGRRLSPDQCAQLAASFQRLGVPDVQTSLGNRTAISDSQTDLWSSHPA